MTPLLVVALLSPAQFPLDENAATFEPFETVDGLPTFARPVKGSPFKEYRIETSAPYTPGELCEALFEWGTRGADTPGLLSSRVVVDGADERTIYAQFSFPIVANRDYVLHVKRERLDAGRCRIRFRTTTASAPPRPDGFVRMDKLWGEWDLSVAPEGGARLSYTLFSDPAGSVPAFLVHGDQRASARRTVKAGLEKTRQLVEQRRSEKP